MPDEKDILNAPAVQLAFLSRDMIALQKQMIEQTQRQQAQIDDLKLSQEQQMREFGAQLAVLTAAWTTSSGLAKLVQWLMALVAGVAGVYALLKK